MGEKAMSAEEKLEQKKRKGKGLGEGWEQPESTVMLPSGLRPSGRGQVPPGLRGLSIGHPGQSPRALEGQGSKERDGTTRHLQIEGLMDFAYCDNDTQRNGRNSNSISTFLLAFQCH